MTCDTIALDPFYDEMIRSRLAGPGLEINYHDYYSFQLDGITSSASQTRFSLSASSINKIYAGFRDANFQSVGVRGHAYPDASGVGAFTSNQLRFRNYNDSNELSGSVRSQYSVNNTKMPQFLMDAKHVLSRVCYAQDKVSPDNSGCLITSYASFNDGKYVNPLLLELPDGRGVAVKSGYDSRGINTMMVWENQGMTIPPADVASQETGVVASLVVAETTPTLRVMLGKDLAVES